MLSSLRIETLVNKSSYRSVPKGCSNYPFIWLCGKFGESACLSRRRQRVRTSSESPKNVTSYDSGRVVLVNKPFFWQVEDKRTCDMTQQWNWHNTSASQAEDSEFESPLSHQYGDEMVSTRHQTRSELLRTRVQFPASPPVKIILRGK